MKLSIVDMDKLSNIYMEKVLVEMDVGEVMGGIPTLGGSIENEDDYATGDTRIPIFFGGVQTRKGKIKKSKKRRKVGTKSAT